MAKASILGNVAVKLGLISEDFNRNMSAAELKFKRFGKSMTGIGQKLSLISIPLFAAGGASLKLASDAEETSNRFNAVFGSMADSTRTFARELANATGRNFYELQDGLASFQGFGQGMGLAANEAAGFSKELQTLAIDFASFNNLSDAEATERFISAMSGSSEVLDKFGVNLRASNLDLKLQELGLAKSTQAATEAQKAIARLEIIKEVMGKQGALGDAITTSESFVNQMRSLTSGITEVGVKIGNILIPIAQQFLGFVRRLVDFAKKLDTEILTRFVKIAGLVAIGGPLLIGLGSLAAAIAAIGLPAIAIGAALAAIVAAIVYLLDNLPAFEAMMVNTFRSVADSVLTSIQQMLTGLLALSAIPGVSAAAFGGIGLVEGLKSNLPDAQDAVEFGSFGRAIESVISSMLEKMGLFKTEMRSLPTATPQGTANTPSFQQLPSFATEKELQFITLYKERFAELSNFQIAQAQAIGQAFDAVAESFARAFVDGFSDLENFGDAFKSMAQSIVSALKEIAVQLLKMAALQGLASLFGLGKVTTAVDVGAGLFNKLFGTKVVESFTPGISQNMNANLFINGRKLATENNFTNFRGSQLGF